MLVAVQRSSKLQFLVRLQRSSKRLRPLAPRSQGPNAGLVQWHAHQSSSVMHRAYKPACCLGTVVGIRIGPGFPRGFGRHVACDTSEPYKWDFPDSLLNCESTFTCDSMRQPCFPVVALVRATFMSRGPCQPLHIFTTRFITNLC